MDVVVVLCSFAVQVVVVGPPRPQADVKDTNWVTVRKPLAEKVPEDAAEGLLQDERGCLLEGLVTNLLIVRALLAISEMGCAWSFFGYPDPIEGLFLDTPARAKVLFGYPGPVTTIATALLGSNSPISMICYTYDLVHTDVHVCGEVSR